MIELKILNQGALPACISYAVAAMGTWYLEQKGIKDSIDALALYEATERNGAANAFTVLEYGRTVGLPGVSGTHYKIREIGTVQQSIGQIQSALHQHGGLVIVYLLHDKDPINKRFTDDWVLSRRPMDQHALVIVGEDTTKRRFRIANSWGENWGDHGYFWLPYEFLTNYSLAADLWVISKIKWQYDGD